jgi:hypothetical protein
MPPRAAVHMAASARPPVHDLQIPTSSWVEVWASLFRCPRAFARFDLQRLHFPMKTQRHTCQNRLKALSASFASPGPTRESHFTTILCDAFDSPPTVAPWRWGSTSMSQTCDHLTSFIPKASPPVSWSWDLIHTMLLASKSFRIMVLYNCTRSIITCNYTAISYASLPVLLHASALYWCGPM